MRVAHQNSSKVLVVEDDAVTREVLVQLLRMAGFDALSAASGQQGLVLLRKHRDEIGWLFTEFEMPGLICGVMLADEFYRSQPSRPVVFAYAHAARTRSRRLSPSCCQSRCRRCTFLRRSRLCALRLVPTQACGEKLRRGGRLSRSTRLGWLGAPSTARLSVRRPRRLLLSIQWARARSTGAVSRLGQWTALGWSRRRSSPSSGSRRWIRDAT